MLSLEHISRPFLIAYLGEIDALFDFFTLILLNTLLFNAPDSLSNGVLLSSLQASLDDFHLLSLGLLDSIQSLISEVFFQIQGTL